MIRSLSPLPSRARSRLASRIGEVLEEDTMVDAREGAAPVRDRCAARSGTAGPASTQVIDPPEEGRDAVRSVHPPDPVRRLGHVHANRGDVER
jgi:hypothetical protein